MTGNTAGLWMLLALGLLILFTGLPVWALLIGVASLFAAGGLLGGVFDIHILQALPARSIGLLENDLLQAMPLYVFVGVLLQRLTVADALYASLLRVFRPLGGAHALAALGVGALIAPTNGSVASSSALLSRLMAPRVAHLGAAQAVSIVSVAATIGVVVPPSLVLLLLGDAMLMAHLEASKLPGYMQTGQRIINTQDVMHATLLPALCVLVLWAVVAWLQTRNFKENKPPAQVNRAQAAIAFIAGSIIVLLLAGVFTGKLYAVEAAATGGVLLVLCTLASRSLSFADWKAVCGDAINLSGALFALLVGATTFSLVFRLFGTDRWINAMLLGSSLPPLATAALVLLLVGLCAWVLDAFEMIFVVIPLVAPVLIARLGDAQQAAVLLLLILQLSFLIPPMGYAVLMARSRSGLGAVSNRILLKALWPMLLAQLAVTLLVFAWPQTVHWLDAPAALASDAVPMSNDEITRQMEEMSKPPASDDGSTGMPQGK
ncbi:MAG: TRAP transporter large permease subunit [Polaromonas sp.]|nr:TRAP transporter large permease subunit [Polaromonas sp.]